MSPLTPEQQARVHIDAMLRDAGWELQDYTDVNFTSSPGVAVREFPTATGPVDYLLVADGKVVGSLEAKREGMTLRQVETQAERYADGFETTVKTKDFPRYFDRLPFHYISTGTEALFTSRRDPVRRPREVFGFHRPETLAKWAQEPHPLRARLKTMPAVNPTGLRDVQIEGLKSLEASLAEDRPKALAAITMGGGKTRLAVAESYRLLRYASAGRILFLVDRISLAEQAQAEFLAYLSPDGNRRFGDDYVVQVLHSNEVEKSANVLICTIQRLYSILRGETEMPDDLDETSSFEMGDGRAVEVSYNADFPVEFFDLIWTDECHRSIYGRWGQVLDYFDSYVVGLTATPTPATLAYFDDNIVAEYTQEQSVYDAVNVDQQLYRIRTEVGDTGGTIDAGEWVKVRDKVTRAVERRQLDDEFIYDPDKLDRAVVHPSQIRTVVKTFRDKVQTEMFPGRDDVPKTIFFAKNDQHAEDILAAIWLEFGRGSEFARKITYKAEGTVKDNVNRFRSDPAMRIAVTVEQIGTGTDIKAVECVVFMRMVGSRTLLNQMRGRAVRSMAPDDFFQVTPGAQEKGQTKDYSVLVDAVGITDEDIPDTTPVAPVRDSVPLKNLLRDIGMGLTSDATLKTVAVRLVRLQSKLSDAEREEFARAAGGTTLSAVIKDLRRAADPDVQAEAAQALAGDGNEPTEDDLKAARKALVEDAVAQLRTKEVRETLDSLQQKVTEQFIHIGGHDSTTFAGFVGRPDEAEDVLQSWRTFIEEHRDEYVVLQAFYSQPYKRRPTLKDVKDLAAAISRPPVSLTTERVWAAYEALETSQVKGRGGKLDADLVRLIRYTLEQDEELVPHEQVVGLRFDLWLQEQATAGRNFSPQQLSWLTMVRDHIARSMEFDPAEDYDFTPFSDHGGAMTAYTLFGPDLKTVISELNDVLAPA